MARRSRAEESAAELLRACGFRGRPVPVDEIAGRFGAEIVRTRSEGNEAGFALRDGSRMVIGVNIATARLRQRFTIAHELGHLVMHPGKPLIFDPSVRINRRNEVSSLGTDFEEVQANAFAAELLIPRSLVLDSVASSMSTSVSHDEALARLASEFDVSKEAMSYRLINLGVLSA